MEIEEARKIAKALTPVAEVVVDFSYSPGGKIGLRARVTVARKRAGKPK
jgi:hypothetical protein